MFIESIKYLLTRDLKKLGQEITSYKNESSIWEIEKQIANSAGNLCLHLVGNLNAYIGAVIGKTGYIRDRDLEFSQKGVSKQELERKIEETVKVVQSALDTLNDEDLRSEYPQLVLEQKTSTGHFLMHLAVHLGYHLGQVNYHRRLLDT